MDFSMIIPTIVDFVKLLLLLSIVSFGLYKIFSPVRTWIEKKYFLSWIQSVLVFNLVFIFLALALFYFYFVFVGFSSAPVRDPSMEMDLFENIFRIAVSLGRILIASVILSIFLLFFELVASMLMKSKEVKSSKKSKSSSNNWVSQFIGVLVASAIFLVLILFVFDWAIYGLFIFVFYGGVNPLPLVMFF
ncbi:MAG: hypothetical protein WCW44_01375 [archaeon]|jgi:hypothetical protein